MPKTKDLPLITTATGAETALVVDVNGGTGRMDIPTLLDAATGQQVSLQQQLADAVARILALEAATGPSAPSISTTVTVSDTTPNTGDTLTAGGGTPAGGSGSYTTHYQWYSTTIATGHVPIAGATSSTLSVIGSMIGAQLSVAKWVIDSNGVQSVPRESALTTAVGGTQAQAIVLSGLPSSTTTSTSASISWTLTPSGGTVFCRRDGFAPAAAPNPFVLGSGTPLSVGSHTVDFYLSLTGDGTDINPAAPMVTYTWTILAAATVTLSGLPASGTTSTTAAIDWVLSPSNAGFVIYKLDGAFQKLATHPINLSALAVGSHTIDFYVTTSLAWDTIGFTLPAVAATYTWSIASSGVTALSQLGLPASINVTGSGASSYNGVTPITVSSVDRIFPVVHSSGVTLDAHRIVSGGSGGIRGEVLHIGGTGLTAWFSEVGKEDWYAFVIRRRSGELSPNSGVYNEILVHQWHWGGYGDTQPPLALFDFGYFSSGQEDYFRWRASGSSTTPGNYADHGGSGTFNWHDPSEPGYVNPWITNIDTRPAAGVYWRYAVRIIPGYLTTQGPVIQVWRGKPGLDMENVTTGGIYTGINEYNDNGNGLLIPSYIRKGPYADASLILASTIGYDISRFYIERNTTAASSAAMLARCEKSVEWAR